MTRQRPLGPAARAAAGTLLSLFLAGALPAGAADPRLRIFLNGSEVATPIVPAERRGSEIYLPVGPIAARLQSEATFDVVEGRLVVTDAILGRVTEYEQSTGLIRRDGAILFGLAPGLVQGLLRGAHIADLLAPLPLVTILFDLEAEIPAGEDAVLLASRVGAPQARLYAPTSVHVRDVRYDGYANHYDGFTDAGLGVEAAARVRDGFVELSAFGQGEEGHLAQLRSANLTYRDPWRSVWSGGDLRGIGEMAWFQAAGRGASWSYRSPVNDRRTAAGLYEILLNSENLGRRISTPHFDGLTALVEHIARPPSGDGLGPYVALGGGWLGATDQMPGGVLAATDALHRMRRGRLGLRAGIFAGTDAGAGNGSGLQAFGEWSPFAVWSLGGSFGRFDEAFRLPRPSFPEAGTRILSLDTALQPDPWFRVSASHSEQHSLASGSLRSRLDNATVGLTTPSRYLRSIYLSGNFYTDSALADRRSLSLNLEGGGRRARWYASSRRTWDSASDGWTHTLGASAYTPGGDGHWSGSLSGERIEGISFYWSLPPFLQRTLQVSFGDRWEHAANLEGKHFYGQFHAAWRGRSGHGVELSIEENQTTTAVRLAVSGGFLFPDVGTAPYPAFGAVDLERGVLFGRAYLDANLNGVYDDGDTPIPGVVVRLDGGRWRQETGADGRYEFPAVEAGPHRLELAEETVRADLTLLERAPGSVDLPGMSRMELDFRVARNRAITGVVFADRNGNGTREGEEEGLPDVRLYLAGGTDALTFHDGTFRMSEVPPGTRVVLVDATSLGSEFELPRAREVQVPSDRDPRPLEIAVPVRARPIERKTFTGD